jgi:hypothetical protein
MSVKSSESEVRFSVLAADHYQVAVVIPPRRARRADGIVCRESLTFIRLLGPRSMTFGSAGVYRAAFCPPGSTVPGRQTSTREAFSPDAYVISIAVPVCV